MLYPTIDPETGKPLAWRVPPAYGSPGGSTYDQSHGFSPEDSGTDSQWWEPKPDPAAFDVRKVSSAGDGGMGRSGQPESSPADGRVSKSAGALLARGAPSQPPPGMDDGGSYQPVSAPEPVKPTRVPPPGGQQGIDATVQRIAERKPPQMIGTRDADFESGKAGVGKEKTGAKLGSWGQRLAMAVLAATKLAPAAMQIVHPQYSQQMGEYQAGQKQDEALLKGQESAETTKALSSNLQAQELLRQAQADPHYGMVRVDPAYAPAITPDENGEVWVPKAAATGLTKPDPAEKLHVVGDSLVDSAGNVLYSGSKNPTSVFGLWIKQHPTGTAEEFQEFESHNQKLDDKERAVTGYLKDNKLSDTSQNRAAALKWYANANQADQRPEQPPQQLMIGPDHVAFTARPGQRIPEGSVTAAGESAGNVPTAATRGMAEKAPRVINFVDRLNQLIDENERQLGPLAGRWNEFTTGKVGLPNKGIAQLRTDAGLLETALMNMHVGARGGEQIMQHFHDLIGIAQQSPENLRAALGEIRHYAEEVAAEGKRNAPQPSATQPQEYINDAGDIIRWNGTKWMPVPKIK